MGAGARSQDEQGRSMKNTMKLGVSAPKTVPQQILIDAMQADVTYSQDEILDLLPDYPRACIRDTLHMLVDKGVVWREGRRSGKNTLVRFSLLEGEALRETIDRKTTRGETPAWMRADLVGYQANNDRFRELCMSARK
jgi:hypothetical protein